MKYEIYQLKEDTMEQVKLRFMASDQAAALGGIHRENYRLVYEGNVETRKDAQQTLDGLFRRFNIDRPTGFEGHSLSVSDIIYLADGESSGWWFCDAYGWKLPDSQTQVYRVGSDGKIGSGSLYAVPDGVSMTGLYWNKKVAKELGITEAPATVEELEADMKKASDAGKLAMMMPAKEGGTSYIYQALLTNYEGRDTVQDWIIQKDGATFNTDGAVKAAQKIKDWQDAGYFSSDALALDGSTALSRFCNGEALFFPSGSWYSASINDALGDDAGWIAFPGGKADSGSAAANAVTAFGIPANAKNKNAAAAFLDFLQSDEARQIAVDNGYPPVGEGETPSTDNQLLGQVLTAYEGLVKTGNTTDYINNATAGMQASAIIPGFQSLIDGTMAPKAFVESIQAQYEKEAK